MHCEKKIDIEEKEALSKASASQSGTYFKENPQRMV